MARVDFHRIRKSLFSTGPLCLVWLIFSAPVAFAQIVNNPLVQAFTVADIGTDAVSWVTRQGPDGVLYFGSDALLSFDGARWRQSPVNGAYALRGLDFGANGFLWAAANNEIGWYQQEGADSWTYHSLLSKLPAEHAKVGESWQAFADGNGAVFVAAEKILRWDGNNFAVWSFPGGRHLQATRTGSHIYVHHSPTGLYVMDQSGPRLVIPNSILGKQMVVWLEQNEHGLLLATSHGLFTFSNDQLVPYAPEIADYIRLNVLTSAVRLSDGRLALGTYRGGIILLSANGTLDRILTEKDGLPSDSIMSLFEDREHGVWATSDFSIFRLTMQASTLVLNPSAGPQYQPIIKIARHLGRINVATGTGIAELDSSTGSFHPLEAQVVHVVDLQATPKGLLVAASGGVTKIADGKATPFLGGLKNAFVVKPSRKYPDKFLVSDGYSILLADSSGQSRILVQNLPDVVSSVAEDDQGRLWMGTAARAILMARPDANTPVEAVPAGAAFGLPDGTGPGRVVPAENGGVLAFSSSGGWILKRHAPSFAAIEKIPAWSINAVSDVAPDGSVWVTHPGTETRAATVARIAIEGDRAIWQPHSVDGLWKIGVPQCIFAEAGKDGETVLWIGGTTQLLRNTVTRGPLAPIPNPPLLHPLARSSDADGLRPIARALPYSTRAIVFEFSAPEFARRPALRLETMLDGVDQRWMPADASSRREFTALREGSYAFRVRTVAETGVTSPAAVSYFVINPPWWRTGTAILGALLALFPAGYGVFRWRVRLLRQRNIELEHKVLERTAQLEKASAAKTQFVANMSHDIRNPLNGIVGLALALEDTWLDVKQRELVATLRECTTYLSTLVDDVLDFASIEAGKVELRPGPFAPGELLRSIAAMFKMEAVASGAVLQVETDPQLPPAFVGDAGRIQQILVNFVTNALKYAGGPVKLTATIPEDAPEEIEFSVVDEGPGISEENQRLLFTKFHRLTASQSKEITGTGLGLASCRLLAGLMSGSVGVRSSPGHGARFYLRLPLDIFPVPAAVTPGSPMASPVVSNCTVLLVEDTNYNAMAATAVLGKFGLACERVCTGAEALRLYAEKRHNLVLLDCNLPDMDGTEVARRIRALEADGPRAIILAVTAYCTLEDRALCLNAGMDAFVGKPLTPQKLRRVLTAAGRRHLAAASMSIAPDVPSAGVDVSLLEYISDGTGHGLGRQIELFLTALGDAENKLTEAAQSGDFKRLADAAHGVISHARLVGSASLATAAAGLQNAALARDRDAFGSLLGRVKREIESLTAVVRRHPDSGRPA